MKKEINIRGRVLIMKHLTAEKKKKSTNSQKRRKSSDNVESIKNEDLEQSKTGEFIVDFENDTTYFIKGCFFLEILQSNLTVSINQITINPKLYNTKIRIYSFDNFPLFQLKLIDNSTDRRKPHAKLKFTPIKKVHDGVFSPFIENSDIFSEILLNSADNTFKDLETYRSICFSIQNRLLQKDKFKEVSILVYGEKNTGKSTLTNYMLNYFCNKPDEFEVNFIDLDVGKSSLNPMAYISRTNVKTPFFINAVNSMIKFDQKDSDQIEFIGENSLSFNPDMYVQKVKELFQQHDKIFNKNGQKIILNIINYHGFVKGAGKIILKRVEDHIPGRLFKVKIDLEKKVVIKEVDSKTSTVISEFQGSQNEYKILLPHFYQQRRLTLHSNYLLGNKNLVCFDIGKVNFKAYSPNSVQTFYKDTNSGLIALIFLNSVVNLTIHKKGESIKNYFGLFLKVNKNEHTIILNVPFLEINSIDDLLLVEVVKTSYLDFLIEREMQEKDQLVESSKIPFLGVKCTGIGASVIRKKVSKRK